MKISEIIAKWTNYIIDSYNKLVVNSFSYDDMFLGLVSSHINDHNLAYSLMVRLKYLKEDRLIDDETYEEFVNLTADIVVGKTLSFSQFERLELHLCLFYQLLPADQIQILKNGGTINYSDCASAAKELISMYDRILLWN